MAYRGEDSIAESELIHSKTDAFAHTKYLMADATQSHGASNNNLLPSTKPDEYQSLGPKTVRSAPKARDITTDFTKAASGPPTPPSLCHYAGIADSCIALNTGQLVKDDFFTLFEAVGALEVRHLDTETQKVVG